MCIHKIKTEHLIANASSSNIIFKAKVKKELVILRLLQLC